MRLNTGQHITLDQRMRLDPRMIQSMEILQLGTPELEARIDQELASNPTLDVQAGDPDTLGETTTGAVAEGGASDGREAGEAEGFERLADFAEQQGDAFAANTTEAGPAAPEAADAARSDPSHSDDFAQRQARRFYGERDAKMDAMANAAARGASLYDQLGEQWRMLGVDPPLLEAGEYLIGLVDADGYLRVPMPEVHAERPEGVSADDVDEALEILQFELEPAGLFARDLRECLLIQIDDRQRREARGERDAWAVPRRLVDQHLPDIEANRLPQIAKQTGLDIEQVKAGLLALRQLTPHPGRLLADDAVVGITPDAAVEYDEATDTYTASLTRGHLPSLTIDPEYEDLYKNTRTDAETKQFLSRQLRDGRWLIDAIEQRANTLLRVVAVVVQAQRGYFEEGQAALKPLPMTGVAAQLGLHVSTVSRAVSDKYLQTPRGVVPLRMFFSGGTTSDEGDAMAWTAVEAKVKAVIDAEDKSKPLSDDAIVDVLKEQGIELARRTVAKYRGKLKIPTARQRKEF